MTRLCTVWVFVLLGLAGLSCATVSIRGAQGGVNGYTGERPFRMEFSSFSQSGPAFDLYILSLHQFVQQPQTDLLSYYEIAG